MTQTQACTGLCRTVGHAIRARSPWAAPETGLTRTRKKPRTTSHAGLPRQGPTPPARTTPNTATRTPRRPTEPSDSNFCRRGGRKPPLANATPERHIGRVSRLPGWRPPPLAPVPGNQDAPHQGCDYCGASGGFATTSDRDAWRGDACLRQRRFGARRTSQWRIRVEADVERHIVRPQGRPADAGRVDRSEQQDRAGHQYDRCRCECPSNHAAIMHEFGTRRGSGCQLRA